MSNDLSNFEIKQGRRIYDVYNMVNSFSFALLTGNTITLYALLLGASSTMVGLLTAFMYLAYFLIPIGKIISRRFTIVRTFAYTWFFRNAGFLPAIFIPFAINAGYNSISILLLVVSVALFNFFRGAGMIAYNPIINLLAPGKDRSSYIVRISLTNNAATLITTIFFTAFLFFTQRAGISDIKAYHFAIVAGIVFGFLSSALLLQLPDPEFKLKKAELKKAKLSGKSRKEIRLLKKHRQESTTGSFTANVKQAFREKNFRRFLLAFFIIQFGISLVRPFLIVYGKIVYNMPEHLVIILLVCASLGALFVGLVMRLVIDKLGAKPIFVILTYLSILSLIPAIIAPFRNAPILAFIFLIIFSIFVNMGFIAQLDAANAYFLTMLPKDAIMNLSMLYFFVLGITGSVGSILGGKILDTFFALGFSNLMAYRIFFCISFVIIAIGMIFQSQLLHLGSRHVLETVAALFSPRDMKALSVLHKLETNKDLQAEEDMIATLASLASSFSADDLNDYLNSPRLSIRVAALNALYSMNNLNSKTKEAMMLELQYGEFTTAGIAAKILGKFKTYQAIPQLRKHLSSEDLTLAGESMIALAKMKDTQSQFTIAKIITTTGNPRLLTSGMKAMEIFNSPSSIPLVLDVLRRKNLPLHIADEACMVLSGVMKFQTTFYYNYDQYKNGSKSNNAILIDVLDEAFGQTKNYDNSFRTIVLDFIHDRQTSYAFINRILDDAGSTLGLNAAILSASIMDTDLIKQQDFRFFLCCWAIAGYEKPELFTF